VLRPVGPARRLRRSHGELAARRRRPPSTTRPASALPSSRWIVRGKVGVLALLLAPILVSPASSCRCCPPGQSGPTGSSTRSTWRRCCWRSGWGPWASVCSRRDPPPPRRPAPASPSGQPLDQPNALAGAPRVAVSRLGSSAVGTSRPRSAPGSTARATGSVDGSAAGAWLCWLLWAWRGQAELLQPRQGVLQRPGMNDLAVAKPEDPNLVDPLERRPLGTCLSHCPRWVPEQVNRPTTLSPRRLGQRSPCERRGSWRETARSSVWSPRPTPVRTARRPTRGGRR
jgi:hypothetical protein